MVCRRVSCVYEGELILELLLLIGIIGYKLLRFVSLHTNSNTSGLTVFGLSSLCYCSRLFTHDIGDYMTKTPTTSKEYPALQSYDNLTCEAKTQESTKVCAHISWYVSVSARGAFPFCFVVAFLVSISVPMNELCFATSACAQLNSRVQMGY